MKAAKGMLLLAVALPGGAAGSADSRTGAIGGQWSGAYTLPASAAALPFTVELRGARATVRLPGGHTTRAASPLRVRRGRVRFSVPGHQPLVFDGVLRGRTLSGTVRHDGVRGRFRLVRGSPGGAAGRFRYLGLFAASTGEMLTVSESVGQFGAGQPRLTVFDSGETRALYPAGSGRFVVGAGVGAREPIAGGVTFHHSGDRLVWRTPAGVETTATRVRVRHEEVRIRSGRITLAGTLSLPAGRGPHPAVVLTHGSGPTPRSLSQIFAGHFLRHGVAVLAYDKRGVGQSGGTWPGEAATPANIDLYARDAQAAARALARWTEIDRSRIGLWGSSQAGWVIPLAAARQPLVSFAVILVGPTVTEGEQVYYAGLTKEGAAVPDLPRAEIERLVDLARPGGADPAPSIRRLRIPVLWVFGELDPLVPTRKSVETLARLRAETGADLTWVVLRRAGHALLEVATGLQSEIAASPRYAPGLFTVLRNWMWSRVISR